MNVHGSVCFCVKECVHGRVTLYRIMKFPLSKPHLCPSLPPPAHPSGNKYLSLKKRHGSVLILGAALWLQSFVAYTMVCSFHHFRME